MPGLNRRAGRRRKRPKRPNHQPAPMRITDHQISQNVWFIFSIRLGIAELISLLMFPPPSFIRFHRARYDGVEFSNRCRRFMTVAACFPKPAYTDSSSSRGDRACSSGCPISTKRPTSRSWRRCRRKFGGLSELRFESIGPNRRQRAAQERRLVADAVLLGICSYIAFAFRKVSQAGASWKYA